MFNTNGRQGDSTGNSRTTTASLVQLSNMDDYVEVVASGPTTVLAPPAPYAGQRFTIKDGGQNCVTYPITFSFPIDGTQTPVMNAQNGMSQTIRWNGKAWRFVSNATATSPISSDAQKVNLVGIGDSRMFLNQANNPSPYGYRFNNGVVNQALGYLGERYNWQAAYNLGVSGDTAQGVAGRLAQVAAVMALRPANEEWDLVYHIDINDALAGFTASTFLGYFKTAMRYFLDKGIRNVFVLGGVPFPDNYSTLTPAQKAAAISLIKQYNAGMSAYCSAVKGLHFVDAYNAYGNYTDSPIYPQNVDIHPGQAGAQIIGNLLASQMRAVRGGRQLAPGQSVVTNPTLYGETSSNGVLMPDNFYLINATSNCTSSRDTTNDALTVTLSASPGVAGVYSIFCNSETMNDTLMPGDIIQAVLDAQLLSCSGSAAGAELKIQFTDSTFVWANSVTSGYGKYGVPGARQVFASDPYTVASGQAGTVAAPYLLVNADAGASCSVNIFEASARRVFTSPNAEYSAAATIPMHRKNIRCLTSTATAAFTLTLPPMANCDDGEVRNFVDTQGAAATHNVTIKGNASETIIDGAAAANTVVLSSNYFTRSYRCDKGAGSWVRQ